MKRIFLFLLTFILAAVIASVYAEPTSVVLTPSNWQDVFNKIQSGYIEAFGSSLYTDTPGTAIRPWVYSPNSNSGTILVLFAPKTVAITAVTDGNVYTVNLQPPLVLKRGIYLTMGYKDSSGKYYAYIYNVNGYVGYLWVQFSGTPSDLRMVFNDTVYFAQYGNVANNQVVDTLTKILCDWRGAGGGGLTAWILFNVSGNMPVSYTITEAGYAPTTLSYGGGSPIYMLYVAKNLPVNVTGMGIKRLFGAGAYLIVGSNWYNATYSQTAPSSSQPSQNQTNINTATLTVTVTPTSYRIQFLSAGALVKEANATLSYAFPKNSTVTVRILDSSGTEKYKFDVKMDSDKYYSFNFGTDNSIYNPTQTYTLTLYFFEMSPSGAYRGQIVVDSVQVVGINASLTRSAQGVSNVRFTNLPAGHYQIIVQKEGYY